MTIILESPDNCGKSTQARLLDDFFSEKGYVVFKSHAKKFKGTNEEQKEKSYRFYENLIKNLSTNDGEVVIWDRSHLGEYIYSPLYRNYDGGYVFDLEEKYKDNLKDVYLFTFIDSVDNIISRDDGLSFSIDPEKKKKEIDLFVQATEKSHIKNKYIVDISKIGNKEQVFSYILSKIDELKP